MKKELTICDRCGKPIPDDAPALSLWNSAGTIRFMPVNSRGIAVDLCEECMFNLIGDGLDRIRIVKPF